MKSSTLSVISSLKQKRRRLFQSSALSGEVDGSSSQAADHAFTSITVNFVLHTFNKQVDMPALRSALSLALECGNGRQGEKDDAAGNKIPTQASVELGDAIGSNSKFGTKLRTMLDEMGELASVLEDDTVAGSVSAGKGTTFQDRFKRFINIGSDGMVSKLVRARDNLLQGPL